MNFNFQKLDELMSNMPAYGLPATDLAVTYKGETVYRRGVGFSDAEKTKPVSPDDVYWIFSVSKITTCIAANRLVEEGKMNLDDPVAKYLPAFANPMVRQKDGSLAPAKNVMTIRHLFTMTGGFDYEMNTPPLIRVKNDPNATTLTAFGADVDNVVGNLDYIEIVLDHYGRIAALDKLRDDIQKLAYILEMESCGRLVEYVERAARIALR